MMILNKRNKLKKNAQAIKKAGAFFMGIKEENPKHEVGEDSTKYGEFISSFFAWIPLQKQKETAERLAKITEKNSKKMQ